MSDQSRSHDNNTVYKDNETRKGYDGLKELEKRYVWANKKLDYLYSIAKLPLPVPLTLREALDSLQIVEVNYTGPIDVKKAAECLKSLCEKATVDKGKS